LLNRFFFQNSAYALKSLDVDLDGTMSRNDFLKKTGIHEGVNIFSINLANAEANLNKDPRVSSVHIERTLPDKVEIQITQRRPVAWISMGSDTFSPENAYLVGMDGILMKPKTTAPEYLSLPVIKGMEVESLREGERPNLPILLSALELIEKNNMAPGSILKIRTMDVSKKYCMEVMNDQNALLTFGLADIDGQLARLNLLLTHCRETNRQIESINLMVHRNTPVRFVMTEAPSPAKNPTPAIRSTSSKSTRVQ
ncbi:MAG: FtsQ-type POTRA domain-containing protein, partial [Chthoniobacterales bacterium]